MIVNGTGTQYTIDLTGVEVQAFSAHAYKDDRSIRGIIVLRNATTLRLVTTDGHRLCEATVQTDIGEASPLLLKADLTPLAKHVGKRGTLRIVMDGDEAHAEATSAKTLVVSHNFDCSVTPPNIDRVIPQTTETNLPKGIIINPRYLIDLTKLLDAVGAKIGQVILSFNGDTDPILVTLPHSADDGTKWRAVIMPMRVT